MKTDRKLVTAESEISSPFFGLIPKNFSDWK